MGFKIPEIWGRDDLGMTFIDCVEVTIGELTRRQRATRDKHERADYKSAITLLEKVVEDVRNKQERNKAAAKGIPPKRGKTSS